MNVLSERKINKIMNKYISKLCDVRKGVNKRIKDNALRYFGRMERMDDSDERAENQPAGKPRKRWIEAVKEFLEKRNMKRDEKCNRREWQDFMRFYSCDPGPRDELYIDEISQWRSVSVL